MREHNDPKGWIALESRQSATGIVIHWTDACAATCIGIDSYTLLVGLLVQKSRGIFTDGHIDCVDNTHYIHINNTSNAYKQTHINYA